MEKVEKVDRSNYDVKALKTNPAYISLTKSVKIVKTDMSDELLQSCTENIASGIETFMQTEGVDPAPELAAEYIKNRMEAENGPIWICVVGESLSFNVNSQKEAYLYCYIYDFGILLYKC